VNAALGVSRIDSADSLRSPWLEALIVVLLVVSTLTVLGRPGVSSYTLVTHYLGVLELVAVLYMAMLAGNLASALENNYASTLLQVPSPRPMIAVGLMISRILAPILILEGASLTGFVLLLWGSLGMMAGPMAVGYASIAVELLGYGSAFLLIALATRSSSKTILLSLLIYLLIGMGGSALMFLGLALSSRILVLLGLAWSPPEAAGVYAGYVDLGIISRIDAFPPLLISIGCVALIAVMVPIYFWRWFEG